MGPSDSCTLGRGIKTPPILSFILLYMKRRSLYKREGSYSFLQYNGGLDVNIIDRILRRKKKSPRASDFKSRRDFWDASHDYTDSISFDRELASTSGLEGRRKSETSEDIEGLERQGFKESGKTDICFGCELVRMTVYYRRNQQGEVVEGRLLCHNCGRTAPCHFWRPRKERVKYALKKGWLKDDMPKGW